MEHLHTLRILVLILLSLPVFAQQKAVKRITAVYDTTAVAELYSSAPIGLEITYADNTRRYTTGLLQGDYRWSELQISSPAGEVRNGILGYNRNRIRGDNYRILLQVTLGGEQHDVWLQLPYLTGIRFRHYTDSLTRGVHYYLNVEGLFSSGRIFPLDTARIRFSANAGSIIGQDLLVPDQDSATRSVHVKAVYRGNPQINVVSDIPVKQGPEDTSIIIQNEKDIFRKPARKKKPR